MIPVFQYGDMLSQQVEASTRVSATPNHMSPRLTGKTSLTIMRTMVDNHSVEMSEMRLILSKEDIARRVQELGAAITKDYAGSDLLVVGVLNGAFIFVADLVREIKLDLQVDFVRVASYGMSSTSCGNIRFSKDVELDIMDRDVLVVEDIVDTGLTLTCLLDYLKERDAKSVRTCALIDKKERREVEVAIHYVGFEVKKGFLVGYGLDYREHHRQFGEVYHLEET